MTTQEHYHKRAKIHWIPALQCHQIICLDCGEVLYDNLDNFTYQFAIPGNCNKPDNALGVKVRDRTLIEDFFGGKPVQEIDDISDSSEKKEETGERAAE